MAAVLATPPSPPTPDLTSSPSSPATAANSISSPNSTPSSSPSPSSSASIGTAANSPPSALSYFTSPRRPSKTPTAAPLAAAAHGISNIDTNPPSDSLGATSPIGPVGPVAPSQPSSSRSLGFLSGWRKSLSSNTSSNTSAPSASPLRNFSLSSDGSRGLFEEPTVVTFGGVDPSTINNGYASDDDDSQFILARIDERSKGEKDSKGMSSFEAFTAQLRSSFAGVRETMAGASSTTLNDAEGEIDWDFWGKVMNNYEEIARRQPKILTRKLQQGIPDAIRGMVWQLMSKGKSLELEATYRTLLTRSSSHEKQIQRDLARTFPKHDHFSEVGGAGQESLFNVIKAYSLYDPEVGYCQGIAFIAGPLLLNMPDEEAFCVLVQLMKAYNFRELFTKSMSGLHLRLYQFDKLLEEMLPVVAKHLEAQDIKSTMYASQWFMTLFAYRFPLEMVFRIMDIVFAEGIEVIFRFSFALLKRNQDMILSLDFEPLLDFLKIGLFDVYINNINGLIQNAASIHIAKSRLDRLLQDHLEELKKNDPETLTTEALRGENRRLQESLKKLEDGYEALNREHIDLAKEHLDAKAAIERSNLRVEELEMKVEGLQGVLASDRSQAEADVKDEMDRLAQKNLELTRRNSELEDTVERLQALLKDATTKVSLLEKEKMDLQAKWDGLRSALKR